MKIVLLVILALFLLGIWVHDLIKWGQSVGTKNYNWRMADFVLTSIMLGVLVILAGRVA